MVTFKKSIACLLAVLMVAFSVPFTAFASYIDDFDITNVSTYHPDLQAQFGAFYDPAEGFDTPSATQNSDYSYSGLYGPPVIATVSQNRTTGALEITKLEQKASLSGPAAAQATVYNDDADDPAAVAIDKVYEEGDIFTVTFRVDNINAFGYISTALTYSDNIEPVVYWRTGKKVANYAWFIGSYSTYTNDSTAGKTLLKFGADILEDQSASSLYDNVEYYTDGSEFDASENLMRIVMTTPTYITVNGLESQDEDFSFIDPVTGAADYVYNDTAVYYTVPFVITGDFDADNPITFTPTDPTNTTWPGYEGGTFAGKEAGTEALATYAEDTESPASEQFTFFGMNINSGEYHEIGGGGQTTTTYTVTYVDAEGTTISTETVEDGSVPANVPTLPANTAHDSYAWDGDVTAAITADTTFTIVKTTSAHEYVGVTTPATCTEDGYTTYTCSICGDSYTEAGESATGHAYGAWVDYDATNHAKTCANCGDVVYEAHVPGEAVTEAGVAPTATEDGYHYEVVSCTVCGRELSREQITDEALGEDYTFSAFIIDTANETAIARFIGDVTGTVDDRAATVSKVVTAATCLEDGSTVYTASYDGVTATAENGGIVTVPIEALGHDLGEWAETTPAVAATCTTAGATAIETRSCSRCDYSESRGGEEISALGHDMTAYEAVPATCLEDGSEAYWICNRCNKMFSDAAGENEISNPITISALGHDMGEWTVTKEATQQAAGEKTRSCSRCDYVETEAIPALGISVTVTATTGGSVTGTVASGETKTDCAFGDSLNLVATPDEGYSFVAWEINGKSVSTSATYNSKVFADLTIEPVFAKNEVEEFTVVFYDIFKNVVSTQTVTSAAELEVPSDASMARNGFTFTGWDVDPATVTKATVINGQYEPDTTIGYTVTVEGADAEITKIAGENTTEKTGIAYDSKVTVTVEGATGFKIGDTVVSTTDSYSFYVGADVTITAVFDAVETVNAIDIISVTPVSGTDYKYQFLATRTVADGYKVEKVGFVYGKNLEDDELTLEKAGQTSAAGTKIKVGYNTFTASVLETSLQYGLTGKTGTIKAKAFMVVSKGGKSEVIYSTLKGYNYQGGFINGVSDEDD